MHIIHRVRNSENVARSYPLPPRTYVRTYASKPKPVLCTYVRCRYEVFKGFRWMSEGRVQADTGDGRDRRGQNLRIWLGRGGVVGNGMRLWRVNGTDRKGNRSIGSRRISALGMTSRAVASWTDRNVTTRALFTSKANERARKSESRRRDERRRIQSGRSSWETRWGSVERAGTPLLGLA
jgi:hypothetical protein